MLYLTQPSSSCKNASNKHFMVNSASLTLELAMPQVHYLALLWSFVVANILALIKSVKRQFLVSRIIHWHKWSGHRWYFLKAKPTSNPNILLEGISATIPISLKQFCYLLRDDKCFWILETVLISIHYICVTQPSMKSLRENNNRRWGTNLNRNIY